MILSIYIASAPWLAGVTTALYLTWLKKANLGVGLLGAGVGGYLGCLAIIAAVSASTAMKWSFNSALVLFALLLYKVFILFFVIYTADFKNKMILIKKSLQKIKSPSSLLIIICISLVMLSIYQHVLSPVHGWDSIDFWSNTAKRFIDHTQSGSDTKFEYQHRHPLAVSLLTAWVASASFQLAGFSSGYWPWFLLWISAGLIVAGFSSLIGLSIFVSFLLGLVTITVPLFENHSLIPGYADFIVAVGFLAAAAVQALSLERPQNKSIFMLGLILSGALLFFKNTGFFYSFILLANLFAYKFNIFKIEIVLFFLVAFSLFLYKIYLGDFAMLEIPFVGYVDIHEKSAFLFKKKLSIVGQAPADVTINQIYALLINLSFSIHFVIFLFSTLLVGKACGRTHRYLSSCFFLGIIFLTLSQFTDHGFIYAVPGNDTGNSRFTLPILLLVPLLTASCVAMANRSFPGPDVYLPSREARRI